MCSNITLKLRPSIKSTHLFSICMYSFGFMLCSSFLVVWKQVVQLLNFDPLNWKTYCSFSCLAEGGSTSLLGLVPSASNSEILLGQCPHLLSSSVSGEMKVVSHVNLPQALEQLGGVQALLFLVAKVSGNPNCVASPPLQTKTLQHL